MRFPRAKFVDEKTLFQQLDHIQTEVDEAQMEGCTVPVNFDQAAMELWDVIHSAETALRILQEKYRVDVKGAMDAVIQKNVDRGYYA
ncbi:MAG: hypothetical protein FD174_2599 [Geobacteraceae bacterium]|nr:MAG: hypothetical protein FD174_2599 [Geobacteraceae bacterium]